MIAYISKRKISGRNVQGFSLIELLVTIAIVGIMMSAVYGIFISNSRSLNVEAERVEIQQSQRIIFDFMARQLRMAGYDRTGGAGATIVDARANFIYFTSDRNDDGDMDDDADSTPPSPAPPQFKDTDEHIVFCIFESDEFGRSLSYITGTNSSFGDIGSFPATPAPGDVAIGHTHDSGNHKHQLFAPIEEIEFFYALDDSPSTTSPTKVQLEDIKSVDITILARADTPDPLWNDTAEYFPASNPTQDPAGQKWGPYEDGFRRRIFTSKVYFRNMGLSK